MVAAVAAVVMMTRRRAARSERWRPPGSPTPTADPAATTPEGRAAFAALAEVAARRQVPGRPVRYDADGFRLLIGDDGALVCNLVNLHRDWRDADPEARPEVLRRFFASMEAPGTKRATLAEVRDRLLPAARGTALQAHITRGRPPGDAGFVLCATPLGDHLAVYLVVDSPDAVSFVNTDDLARWGLTEAEALAIAVANLRSRELDAPVELVPGCLLWHSDDAWAGGFVMLTDVLRALPVRGDPVVMIANPTTLLVAGADDDDALLALAAAAERALDVSRPISGLVLRLRGGGWEPFLPRPGSPAYAPLHALALDELAALYADDKQARDAAGDEDVFVASLMVATRKADGAQRSIAVWPRDTPTLLPEAEFVALVDGEGPSAMIGEVAWDALRAELGAAMAREPGYPPRWRVSGWLTPAQLLALGVEAN